MTKEKTEKNLDRIAWVLIFCSGFLNSYSFLLHNGAFATMQTGNLIHAMIKWSNGKWLEGAGYLAIILAFLVSTFLAKLCQDFLFKGSEQGWKKGILLYQFATLVVVAVWGAKVPHIATNSLITSGAAMQYCAFRNTMTNAPYATIFCTGNMRSFVDQVYDAIVKKERSALQKVGLYGGLLCSFALGVVMGSLGVNYFQDSCIWLVCGVFLVLLGWIW